MSERDCRPDISGLNFMIARKLGKIVFIDNICGIFYKLYISHCVSENKIPRRDFFNI